MLGIRAVLRQRAGLIALLLGIALAARALVPAGYMAAPSARGITIELCSGVAGKTVTIALPGTGGQHHDDKAKADMPCAFAGTGFDQAKTIDPILLAIAIAFIIAMGFRHRASRRDATPAFLRPPLRGPPHA